MKGESMVLSTKTIKPLPFSDGKAKKRDRSANDALKEVKKDSPDKFQSIAVNLRKGKAEQNISAVKYSKTRKQRYVRRENAAAILQEFNATTELIGMTKGQFSLSDLIIETAKIIGGKTSVLCSTWNVTLNVLEDLQDQMKNGTIKDIRFLLDYSMGHREPEVIETMRKLYGLNAIRIGKNHSKITTIGNDKWKVVILCSMNLNKNPRFEFYFIRHDPQLYGFLIDFFDKIFENQKPGMIFLSAPEQQDLFKDM
jgi:hypothetical protein